MRKLLKTLACSAAAALLGASALADYGWYDGSMSIGGVSTDFMSWSTDGEHPTDLGDLTDMTITSVDFNVWSDANDRGGANMFFRIWDGGASPVGSDQDLWLGASSRISGDHNFAISWSGTEDLASAVGLTLEHGHAYYIDMWAKTYGDSGDEWYSAGGANFHAKLTYRKPQTVTFDWSGAPLDPIGPVVCPIGGEYDGEGFDMPCPVWEGHVWRGWYVDPDDVSTRVRMGDIVSDADTLELHALWTAAQTVYFNANGEGAVVSQPSKLCPHGGKYAGFASATWENHRFLGWYTQAEGGERIQAGMDVTDSDSRQLFAQWAEVQTVLFDANGEGATASKPSTTCLVGGKYSGFASATWANHLFRGWYTERDGGTRIQGGMDVEGGNSRTLYAHWDEVQTVLFDANGDGATASKPSTVCLVGGKYSGFASATWANHAFLGWYTEREDGSRVKGGMDVEGGATLQLYAHWKETAAAAPAAITGFAFGSRSAHAARGVQKSVKYTVANKAVSVTEGTAPDGSSATYAQTASQSGQITGTTYAKLTLSGYEGMKITGLTLEMHSNGSKGSGSLSVTCGTATIASIGNSAFNSGWSTAYTTDWVNVVPTVTATTIDDNDVVINIEGSVNSLYIQSYTINYEAPDPSTPTVTLSPSDAQEVYVGGEVAIAATASGFTDNDNVAWSWFVDGVEVAGATSSAYTFTASAEGTYEVTAKGTYGTENAESVAVRIKVNAPKTTSTVTYTVTSKTAVSASGDEPPVGSSATYSQTYTTVKQAIANNSLTLTLSGYEGQKIVGLTLSMRSNGSGGAGNLSVTCGDATIASIATASFSDDTWHGSYSSSYVDVTPSVTETVVDDDVVITISATENSLYCESYTVEYKTVPLEFSITLDPADDFQVVQGESASITATPHNAAEGNVTYAWAIDEEPVAGVTGDELVLDTSTIDVHEVVCTATDADGAVATASVWYEVTAPAVAHDVVLFTNGVGTVEADVYSAYEGDPVTLTVVPGNGYKLGSIEVNDEPISGTSFGMPDDDAAVVVTFVEIVPHDVVVFVNGEGTAEADADSAYEGEMVTLTVNPGTGYKLESIVVNDEPLAGLSFVMPDDDAAVVVTFVEKEPEFVKITSLLRQLRAGQYVITGEKATGEEYAMLNSISGTSTKFIDRRTNAVAFNADGGITNADANIVWTLSKTEDGWTIYQEGFGYVGYVASGNSSGAEQTASEKSTWTIAESGSNDGLFEFTNVGDTTRNLRYNSGSPRFACYDNATGKKLALYRKSVPIQTVTFNVNGEGASCLVDWVEVDIGDVYTNFLPAVWENHIFRGWYIDPSDATTRVRMGDIVTDADTLELKALWTSAQTVYFNANGEGAVVSQPSKMCPHGSKYAGFASATWENHRFLGWYTQAEGGERIQAGMDVTDADTRTLFAHWEEVQTVLFEANGDGAVVSKPSTTCPIGGKYANFASATWENHLFKGWYTQASGGERIQGGMDVAGGNTLTLYAQWVEVQTVLFDANGDGAVASKPSTVCLVGGNYSGFASATWANHAFKGWYTEREDGERVMGGMPVEGGNSITLYAHWKELAGGAAPSSITGFSMTPRATAPVARAADSSTMECTLWVLTSAGTVYEIQWTSALDGEEWTVLKHWTAEEDAEEPVTVDVPADSPTGFLRVVPFDAE